MASQRSCAEIDGLDKQLLVLELQIGGIAVRTVDSQNADILVEFPDIRLFCVEREIENIQEIGVARLFLSDVFEDSLLLGKVRVLE